MVLNRANYFKQVHFLVCAFIFEVPHKQKKSCWLIFQRECFKGCGLCVSSSFVLSFSLFFSSLSFFRTQAYYRIQQKFTIKSSIHICIYRSMCTFIYTRVHILSSRSQRRMIVNLLLIDDHLTIQYLLLIDDH